MAGTHPMPMFSPAWIRWAANISAAKVSKELNESPIPSDLADEDCFSSLPYDVIMKLFVDYLHPCELRNVMCLSSSSNSLFEDERMWKYLCAKQLKCKVKNLDTPYRYTYCEQGASSSTVVKRSLSDWDVFEVAQMPPMSFRSLYTKLLYPFRGALGKILRTSCGATPWGLILTVEYRDGIISGWQWMLPRDASDHMIPVSDFSVYVDGVTDQVVIVNHLVRSRVYGDPTPLRQLVYTDEFTTSHFQKPLCFQFRRGIGESFAGWDYELDRDFIAFRNDKGVSWPDDQFFVPERGLYPSKQKWLDLLYSRMGHQIFYHDTPGPQPSDLRHVGVIAGYFKANLKSRGTQLFKVYSPTRGDSTDAVKVTGDCVRSCEKQAFWFNLRNGIIVPPDQLEAVNQGAAEKWNHSKKKCRSVMGAVRQEFKVPPEMHPYISFDVLKIPKYCLGRFTGKWHPYDHSRRASLQQESTKPTNAQLVVFSATSFLVLWYHPYPCAILFEKVGSDDPFSSFIH